MKKNIIIISMFFIFLSSDAKFCVSTIYAEEINIHGFTQGTYTFRTKSDQQKNRDIIINEGRLRLDISSFGESGESGFKVKTDFVHDSVTSETKIDFREAYIDIYEKKIDLRIGRQIITWGSGDMLFINDFFSKNWNAFYGGENMEFLKTGVQAIKLGLHPDKVSFEMIAIPIFQADELPSPDRFSMTNPFSKIPNQSSEMPDKKFKNAELALKIYSHFGNGDLSVYTYKGFYHTPSARQEDTTSVTYFYPELNVYGASYEFNGLGGVINIEGGFYDSRNDYKGIDPLIDNSRFKALLGYNRQIANNLNLGLQYYFEDIKDYDTYKENLPANFIREDKTKQTATLRLTQFLKYETWKLSLFAFYGITEKDYMLIPEASYKMTDELSLIAGGNIIEGKKDYTNFGRFKENDNVYMRIKYDF